MHGFAGTGRGSLCDNKYAGASRYAVSTDECLGAVADAHRDVGAGDGLAGFTLGHGIAVDLVAAGTAGAGVIAAAVAQLFLGLFPPRVSLGLHVGAMGAG